MAKADKHEQDLINRIKQLGIDIGKQDPSLSEYSMGASGAYDASSEDPDVALMRRLAEQLRVEEQALQPSNMAAQLSMIYDPNFAAVFKDATSQRVNAARNYFGNIGTISRQAQSGRAARAKSRKRSGAVLAGLTRDRTEAQKALDRLRLQRERIAQEGAQRRQTEAAKPEKPVKPGKGPPSDDTEVKLGKARDRFNARLKDITGTPKERQAEFFNLGKMMPMLRDSPMGPEMKKELLALRWDVDALQYLYDEEKLTRFTQKDWARAKRITAKRAGLNIPEEVTLEELPAQVPGQQDWLRTIQAARKRLSGELPATIPVLPVSN
jgi:hypothetical protein